MKALETKPCQLNKQLLKVVPILLLLALTFPFLYFMSSDYSVFSDDSETQSSNSVSATQVVSRRGRLKILEYDSQLLFPYPNLTYPARKMLRSKWATNLKAALNSAELNKQITFLMVSFDYFSTLINWLLHAKLHAPLMLKDLLVVCLDDRSHKVLHDKGIVSSVVTVNDIVQSISDIEGPLFHARVVVRLTVLRLLNYWGYDVLQMDIDAILMKNIQPLFAHFSDVDIITSTTVANCIPKRAHRAWGFCMCVGALLIRSNEKTEKMWQRMGHTPIARAGSDQNRFNSILVSMEITWDSVQYNGVHYSKGVSSNHTITGVALPEEVACRGACDVAALSSYYICHPHSSHHGDRKESALVKYNLWKVSDHWNNTINGAQGTMDWLNDAGTV